MTPEWTDPKPPVPFIWVKYKVVVE
jgi:hypothetical protein